MALALTGVHLPHPLVAIISPLTSILLRASDDVAIAHHLLAVEPGGVMASCTFSLSAPAMCWLTDPVAVYIVTTSARATSSVGAVGPSCSAVWLAAITRGSRACFEVDEAGVGGLLQLMLAAPSSLCVVAGFSSAGDAYAWLAGASSTSVLELLSTTSTAAAASAAAASAAAAAKQLPRSALFPAPPRRRRRSRWTLLLFLEARKWAGCGAVPRRLALLASVLVWPLRLPPSRCLRVGARRRRRGRMGDVQVEASRVTIIDLARIPLRREEERRVPKVRRRRPPDAVALGAPFSRRYRRQHVVARRASPFQGSPPTPAHRRALLARSGRGCVIPVGRWRRSTQLVATETRTRAPFSRGMQSTSRSRPRWLHGRNKTWRRLFFETRL